MFMSFAQQNSRDAAFLRDFADRRHKPMSGEAGSPSRRQDRVNSNTTISSTRTTLGGREELSESSGRPHSASRHATQHVASSPYPVFRRPSAPIISPQRSSSSSSSQSNPAALALSRSSSREEATNSPTSPSSARQVRLPPFSAIAGHLPELERYSHQPSTSSPIRPNRSNQSRGSSSRGSSPRSYSSGSSRDRTAPAFTSQGNLNTLRSSAEAPDFRYELIIRQQPGRAAAAGLSPSALSRIPIVASPILRLRVTDQTGRVVPHRHVVQNLPYLVCSCSLVSSDNEGAVEPAPAVDFVRIEETGGQSSTSNPSPLAMLCGTRVYSAVEAIDTDGELGLFFIFWDVSVRQVGSYRLKFSLVEALPGSPIMTTALSDPFDTVQLAEFPGDTNIATELSRHFHRQGLTIYLPPLALATGL